MSYPEDPYRQQYQAPSNPTQQYPSYPGAPSGMGSGGYGGPGQGGYGGPGQGGYGGPGPTGQWPAEQWPAVKPDNRMTLSVLSTIFGFLPLGIAAIVKSSQVDGLWGRGDQAGAVRSSTSAKNFAISAFVVGAILVVLSVVLVVLTVAGVLFGSSQTRTASRYAATTTTTYDDPTTTYPTTTYDYPTTTYPTTTYPTTTYPTTTYSYPTTTYPTTTVPSTMTDSEIGAAIRSASYGDCFYRAMSGSTVTMFAKVSCSSSSANVRVVSVTTSTDSCSGAWVRNTDDTLTPTERVLCIETM